MRPRSRPVSPLKSLSFPACLVYNGGMRIRTLTALPVYNEVRHVTPVLDEACRYSQEVLVVDDGSTDGTAALLAERRDLRVVTHRDEPRLRGGAGLGVSFRAPRRLRRAGDDRLRRPAPAAADRRVHPRVRRPRRPTSSPAAATWRHFPATAPRPRSGGGSTALSPTELNARLGPATDRRLLRIQGLSGADAGEDRLTETGYAMPLEFWVQAVDAGLKIVELPVPLIYLEEARSFGGALDNAEMRLAVYREVLERSMRGCAVAGGDCDESAARLASDGCRREPAEGRSADGGNRAPRPGHRSTPIRWRIAGSAPRRPTARCWSSRRWTASPTCCKPTRAARQAQRYDFGGVALAELSRQARRELVAEALRWTASYRDVAGGRLGCRPAGVSRRPPAAVVSPGRVAQELRPGDAGEAPRRDGGQPDRRQRHGQERVAARAGRIGGAAHGGVGAVGRAGPVIPFEERAIVDRGVFEPFGVRAAQQIAPLVRDPMLRRFWPLAVERSSATTALGDCLAQSRHQLEGHWGFDTLEVPQSRVCRTASFAWFTAHLFAAIAAAGRGVQRGGAGVSPRAPHPQHGPSGAGPGGGRRRGTKRRSGSGRATTRGDGGSSCAATAAVAAVRPHGAGRRVALRRDGDVAAAAERLLDLSGGNVRHPLAGADYDALARLVLGDLFLHGIGGAKYDQLTDAMIARFFGLEPPGFMVLSATLLLPGAVADGLPDALRESTAACAS